MCFCLRRAANKKEDSGLSGIALAAMERGAYINLSWPTADVRSAWARIKDDLLMIVLAVDLNNARFAITNKKCFEGNLGPETGVLGLRFEERSLSIDATFKIERGGDVALLLVTIQN